MATKILVYDTDSSLVDLLSLALDPKQFTVLSVSNAADVLETIKKQAPDVLIFDPAYAGEDIWKLCTLIRRSNRLPILALSAVNHPGSVANALDNGIDDYLVKPVPAKVLTAHLNRLTRRAWAEMQASLYKPLQ